MLGQREVAGQPGRRIRPEPPCGPVAEARRPAPPRPGRPRRAPPRTTGLDRGFPGRALQLDPADLGDRPLGELGVDLGERQVPEQFPGLLEHLHFAAGRRALGQLRGEGSGGRLGQLTIDVRRPGRHVRRASAGVARAPGHRCKSSSNPCGRPLRIPADVPCGPPMVLDTQNPRTALLHEPGDASDPVGRKPTASHPAAEARQQPAHAGA